MFDMRRIGWEKVLDGTSASASFDLLVSIGVMMLDTPNALLSPFYFCRRRKVEEKSDVEVLTHHVF